MTGDERSESALEAELDLLLEESSASAEQRASCTFDGETAPFSQRLVLFGAGGLGRRTLRGLRALGIEPLAFSDNNPALWGKDVEGLRVLAPADAIARHGADAAFVLTIWGSGSRDSMAQRLNALRDRGCARVTSFATLYWKHPAAFLPYWSVDLPRRVLAARAPIRRAFAGWSDASSRREFVAQLRWRLLLDFQALPPPVAHEIYFPEDLRRARPDELFVDCGAYDGDSLRTFLQRSGGVFQRVVAFEPDPRNWDALVACVAALPEGLRSRIHLEKKAVGRRTGPVQFDAMGNTSSAAGAGELTVDCTTLDDALKGAPVTAIKMDIEGGEPDALFGAARLLRDRQPFLSICSYHRQDHLWTIPLLITSAASEYRLHLRPHGHDVWDLLTYAVSAEESR